jgi:hypothetical protein
MTDNQTPPTLNDLLRTAALRDRLRVTTSASTADVNTALRAALNDRDDDQPGRSRLVRSPETNVSDLLRALRDMPDGDEEDA